MGIFDNRLTIGTDTVPRHISGIWCDVSSCVYHDGDNFCTAERVSIGNMTASSAAETRCSTFRLRGDITRGT